jgi:predicted ATPase/class 3 adenylate cyclase
MDEASDLRKQLEKAIAAQESLRPALGDAVVDATVSALKEKLAAFEKPAAAEERKQVTILFADVSGFTAMSEKMDAEDVRNTMNALWAKLDEAIVKHGGKVDKHIGDAVMALFGVPAAQEDDPERAVRAALRMQKELAEFSSSTGRPLKMRIGIHCGPVLLGSVGSNAEFTAMGDTVNLASRLEHAAPVGGILISNDVVRQVWGDFDAKELEPITVKGKKDPVQVYVVEKARPRSFRRQRAEIDTPMVGRDAELKALQDALGQACEDGEAAMVTLVGEAGVGKSRLLYEFDRWCEKRADSPWYFMGRASQQMQSVPYALLRDIFAFRFGILENDGAADARQKLVAGVAGFFPGDPNATEKAHFIGQLIGLDFSDSPHLKGILAEAAQIRDRALACLVQLFTAANAKRPSLILVEDVHWADERSLDVLAYLFKSAAKLRLCAICVTRPSLFERRPSWGEGQAYHRRVDLKPLSKVDVRRMVATILGKLEAVPQKLKELIVDEAGGNPFYVEELIKMLCEEGVIVKGEGPWRVEESRLAGFKVPSTLVGVLQARLDSLPQPEREAVQMASVVGRTFWDAALEKLGSQTAERRGAVLDAIRSKEMVFRRESSAFTGSDEYIFKHVLLRDVAYDSVLKRLRPEYHQKVADWLVAAASERQGEYAGLIAEHYEKAGLNEKASEHLERAGVQALRISALRDAQSFFQRALSLLPESAQARRCGLELQLGETAMAMGAHAQTRAHLEKALELSRARGDAKTMTAALNGLSSSACSVGDYKEANRRGTEALELSRKSVDDENTARALIELSITARFQNDLPKAKELLSESLKISQARGDEPQIARGLHLLGLVARFQCDYDEAKGHLNAAIALQRKLANPRGIAQTLNLLGIVQGLLKQYDEARRHLEEAVALNTEIGNRQNLAAVLDSLAYIEADQGKAEQSRAHLLQAMEINQELGTTPSLLTNLALVARLKTSSDPDRALELASLILGHASSNNESKQRASAVLAQLKAAPSVGNASGLEEVVARELAA